jgi:hypothetical protein
MKTETAVKSEPIEPVPRRVDFIEMKDSKDVYSESV